MSDYVFVYGTLKRGFGNSVLLNEAEFVQEAVTEPKYTMRNLGFFPGVQLEGNTPISGEIYKVTDKEMERLDRLEGYPSFYNRTQIGIPGLEVTPWMYFLPKEGYQHNKVVPSGVWG